MGLELRVMKTSAHRTRKLGSTQREHHRCSSHSQIFAALYFSKQRQVKQCQNCTSDVKAAALDSGMPDHGGLRSSFLSFPQDVLGGILVTAVLIVLTYPAWTLIDRLDSASPLFPVCVIVVPFFLCYNYPVSDCYSPTRADTTTILAAGAGVTLGFWINHFFQLASAPTEALPVVQNIPPLTANMLVLGLTKFAVGIVLILLVRQLVQNLSLQVLYSCFKVVTRNKEARRRLEIEVPYKFVTYTSVGLCATTFVPMLHRFLGLL